MMMKQEFSLHGLPFLVRMPAAPAVKFRDCIVDCFVATCFVSSDEEQRNVRLTIERTMMERDHPCHHCHLHCLQSIVAVECAIDRALQMNGRRRCSPLHHQYHYHFPPHHHHPRQS